MEKRTKTRLGIVVGLVIVVIAVSLYFIKFNVDDIDKVPSQVDWPEDMEKQITSVRSAENLEQAENEIKKNKFPLKAKKLIPEKAKELNLAWANKKVSNFKLFLFSAEKPVKLYSAKEDKTFKVRLQNFEPGFIVKYNQKYDMYLLESFAKVVDKKQITGMSPVDYQPEKKKKEPEITILKQKDFSARFYPCEVYDDIIYWRDFAKRSEIKLLAHSTFSDGEWELIDYDEAQLHLTIGYVIALDLPDGSSYLKMSSGKEFIKTATQKLEIKYPA